MTIVFLDFRPASRQSNINAIGGIGIIVVGFLVLPWIALPASILTGTLYERSLDE